ncbi:MAG: hypothetical protein ACLPTZ_17260 [Beijerinckiaceae bacterium]
MAVTILSIARPRRITSIIPVITYIQHRRPWFWSSEWWPKVTPGLTFQSLAGDGVNLSGELLERRPFVDTVQPTEESRQGGKPCEAAARHRA